jgi:hypothetical protein
MKLWVGLVVLAAIVVVIVGGWLYRRLRPRPANVVGVVVPEWWVNPGLEFDEIDWSSWDGLLWADGKRVP